jgi:hypothetical protein
LGGDRRLMEGLLAGGRLSTPALSPSADFLGERLRRGHEMAVLRLCRQIA